jgi:hypothetical protein
MDYRSLIRQWLNRCAKRFGAFEDFGESAEERGFDASSMRTATVADAVPAFFPRTAEFDRKL